MKGKLTRQKEEVEKENEGEFGNNTYGEIKGVEGENC
jgi:hypothetical protein